ncbi:MAG: hypothetical protein K9K40_08895, partial [Desulfotignum sp.]|nr:hypothetical protein [Desulfotignum sp.]
MSRIVPAQELDLIERIISEHTRGIGISALESALLSHLPKALHRRTLQRRLKRLLKDKHITTEGESIALVYKPGPRVVLNAEQKVTGSSMKWASSRLEGNTYNRLDTQNLIQFGQAAKGKDMRETQMILNHKAAIEMLIQEADLIGFNPFTFLNLHSILSENLLPDQ